MKSKVNLNEKSKVNSKMSSSKRQKVQHSIDPFSAHFENNDLDEQLNDAKLTSEVKELNALGRCKYEFNEKIREQLESSSRGDHPNGGHLNGDHSNEDLTAHFKPHILNQLNQLKDLNELQSSILRVISAYQDLQFNECTIENRTQIMQTYCIHALNHVLKTRTRVINNNQRLRKDPDAEFKDQGFTRPKVLIVLPFRNSAYHLIDYLVKLFAGNKQPTFFDKEIRNDKKNGKKASKKASSESEDDEEDQLDDEYLLEDVNENDEHEDDEEGKEDEEIKEDDEVKEDEAGKEPGSSKITIMNLKKFKSEFLKPSIVAFKKPDDHKQIFDGNTNEYFRIGIEITKKSLKLYSRFYSSDIIVASPLGLRTILGAEGEKRRDYDFLSSIELLIMDQTELFLMQNWEHVTHLLKNVNLQPKDHHNTDFSRIRLWSLNGLGRFYRQTLVFSSIKSIYISSLFAKHALNFEGRLQQVNFERKLAKLNPVLSKQVALRTVEHRFQRYSVPDGSLASSADARFKFFVESVLPKFNSSTLGHTLIYIPSYFDFLRLRNYMRKEEISFTQICEHTEKGKMAQARKRFFTNQRTFLLYTERAHFYNRFSIKGIHQLVFYQLPTFPHYYTELANLLVEQNQRKDFVDDGKTFNCTSLYDQFDRLLLAQIVGLDKTTELLNSFTSLSIL